MKKRLNKLTEQDKAYIRTVHANSDLDWDTRMSMLITRFAVSERTIRRWIARLGYSSYKEIENEEIRMGKLRDYDYTKKYFIFTWAQNATPVHKNFWDNLIAYTNYLDANLGVVQGRYQNPTSLWSTNMQDAEWWDLPLQPYLDAGRHNIHEYLDILSDVKVRPTAVNPLTGFEGVSGGRSSIIGHPRIHLRSLPVLKGHPNKLIMTTGACTIKNYTDTKAGKKAEFHHTYGFVIVEVKDDLIYYVRQVTAEDSGSFIDLNNKVDKGKVGKVKECDGFVMGDIHAANVHHPVVERTIDMFSVIRPRNVIFHDLFDGESVNHHEAKDPIKAYHRYVKGSDVVDTELSNMFKFIDQYNLTQYGPIVVRSNHDVWLDRWVVEKDWKKDIPNAKEYFKYGLALLNNEASKGLIPYLLDQRYGDKITTLGLDDSYKINGWEVGQHGHLGTHGSKGNLTQFKKLNTKVIVGDYHQPGRQDGAVGVGTYSNLRLGYNNGPSAWMNAGAIIHKNGKVQHIIFQEDGHFTTFKDFK